MSIFQIFEVSHVFARMNLCLTRVFKKTIATSIDRFLNHNNKIRILLMDVVSGYRQGLFPRTTSVLGSGIRGLHTHPPFRGHPSTERTPPSGHPNQTIGGGERQTGKLDRHIPGRSTPPSPIYSIIHIL